MQEFEHKVRRLQYAFPAFSEDIRLACEYIEPDAASSLTKSRMVMEKLLIVIYKQEMGREPKKPLLGEILADNQFTRKLDRRLLSRINSIRDMGNLGPHGETVDPTDAVRVLDDLCVVLDWYLQRYNQAVSGSAANHRTTSAFERSVPSRKQKRISVNVFTKGVGCSVTIALTLLIAVMIFQPRALPPLHDAMPPSAPTSSMPPPSRPPEDITIPRARSHNKSVTIASMAGHLASPSGTGWITAVTTVITEPFGPGGWDNRPPNMLPWK